MIASVFILAAAADNVTHTLRRLVHSIASALGLLCARVLGRPDTRGPTRLTPPVPVWPESAPAAAKDLGR
jgi:phytoene/squalene synthetase